MVVVLLQNGTQLFQDKDAYVHFTETGIIITSKNQDTQHIPYTSYSTCSFKIEKSNIDIEKLNLTNLNTIHGKNE